MLTLFRRHLKGCPHNSRSYRRCKCPIHVDGSLGGQKIRKSLDLTNWEAAQNQVREWEVKGEIRVNRLGEGELPTVGRALDLFMEDSRACLWRITNLRGPLPVVRKNTLAGKQGRVCHL
jgi:hypothetical protein